MTNLRNELLYVYNKLNDEFSDAKCGLYYSKDYELAIAVILSAQSKDDSVNKISKDLFKKYPTLLAFKNAKINELEADIKSIGLYRNKAKEIKKFATQLYDKFDAKLPHELFELKKLSGVGDKTARVIRIEIFKIPDFPCDTHVRRILLRLGYIHSSDTPEKISQFVIRNLDKNYLIKFHYCLIAFGRKICSNKKPKCNICHLKNICNFN